MLAHVMHGLSVFDGELQLQDWLEFLQGRLLCLSGVFTVTVFANAVQGKRSGNGTSHS